MIFCSPEVFWQLIRNKARLSGVLARLEDIGYIFCRGANFEEMLGSNSRFPEIAAFLRFMPVAKVSNKSARLLMQAIHNLNATENLPGIKSFMSTIKLAA
jgi:hypothetical protein